MIARPGRLEEFASAVGLHEYIVIRYKWYRINK